MGLEALSDVPGRGRVRWTHREPTSKGDVKGWYGSGVSCCEKLDGTTHPKYVNVELCAKKEQNFARWTKRKK